MTAEETPPIPGGHFDYPTPETSLSPGYSRVSGWALAEDGPLDRLTLTLNGVPVGRARLGDERQDLAEAFQMPKAALGGFQHMLDLRQIEPGPTLLSGWGEDSQGRRVEMPTVELRLSGSRSRRHGGGMRILVFTHDLAIGGAQIVLSELLRKLAEDHGATGTVLSPRDGATRQALEKAGFEVRICGEYEVQDLDRYERQMSSLATESAVDFDVALINTATSYPGADIASRIGIPAVWIIHESYGLAGLFADNREGNIHPDVQARAAKTLSEAPAVIFEVEATRRLYLGEVPDSSAKIIPYGIDIAAFDQELGAFSRAEGRQRIGAAEKEFVILCLGTIEPRKGQTQLVQAFARAAADRPDARLMLVGSREDGNDAVPRLAAELSGVADRVEIRPVSDDVASYYRGSDLLVCASDIESLPRTVIEAMAARLPVLATDAFGLPEVVSDGKTGWLCQTRDTGDLAHGLRRAMKARKWQRWLVARAARALVENQHELGACSSRYAEVIRKAI